METQETPTGWVNTLPPATPFEPPAPTPKTSRSWRTWAAGGIAATILVATAGAIGYFVADDSDELDEMQSTIADYEDDIDDLEDDLDNEGARRTTAEATLQTCVEASESSRALIEDVDAMVEAHDSFMAAAIGSPEEAEAWFEFENAFYGVVGSSRSAGLATGECVADSGR